VPYTKTTFRTLAHRKAHAKKETVQKLQGKNLSALLRSEILPYLEAYFTLQPYGRVAVVGTGFPAITASSASLT
jgi:hypothetical protein